MALDPWPCPTLQGEEGQGARTAPRLELPLWKRDETHPLGCSVYRKDPVVGCAPGPGVSERDAW